MAHTGGDSHQGGHGEGHHHNFRGAFGKVKDSLDFTKHLGFQGGADTLGNRAALERARERDAQRAAQEEQNPSPEAGTGPDEGITGVADTLSGIVGPKSQVSEGAPSANEQNSQGEPVRFYQSPPHSSNKVEHKTAPFDQSPSHSSSKVEHKTAPVEQGEEKVHESGGGWGGWMAHKVHRLSRAVASKDLSDELLKKEAKAKNTK